MKMQFFNIHLPARKIIWTIACLALTLPVILWFLVTQPTCPVKTETVSGSVNPERLKAHVRSLTKTFFPRSSENPENLDRAANYIRKEFKKAGGRVVDQPFEIDSVTYRNVIAHFGPETGDRIIIGAHYDTCEELPGADDNAGAVAGLIELAHLLKNTRLNTHVELVAFTLEEPPYFRTPQMGSAVHAASLKKQGARVRLMIALEMIGYFSEAEGSQIYPSPVLELFYPSKGNFIAVVGNFDQIRAVRQIKKTMRSASSLPVHSINTPAIFAEIDFSDHRNYWEAGYDAVMITDTAFYRNPNYHTEEDTADTLDYGKIALVVQGVYASTLAIDKKD